MSNKITNFKLMKSGYDRFAVDNTLEEYRQQIETLQNQIKVYDLQINKANEEFTLIKQRYEALMDGFEGKEKAADEIARLALRESNRIIDTAQSNADAIISEALTTAKLILNEVSNLSKEVVERKEELLEKTQNLRKVIEEFETIEIPVMKHIKD